MRLSTRMRLNFESLSLRSLSRCFRIDTAFFTRKYRSSGMDGARLSFLRIRRILLSVIIFTCGTPKLSLNVTPMDEGVIPFFANLQICSLRSSGYSLIQLGARRLYGSVVEDMPLPGPYMRPMVGSPRSTPYKPRLEPEMTRT